MGVNVLPTVRIDMDRRSIAWRAESRLRACCMLDNAVSASIKATQFFPAGVTRGADFPNGVWTGAFRARGGETQTTSSFHIPLFTVATWPTPPSSARPF